MTKLPLIDDRLLVLIAKNDGKYSWYQLDRALSRQGVGSQKLSLIEKISLLEANGLIRSGVGPNPSQPVYFMTPLGFSRLETLDQSISDG